MTVARNRNYLAFNLGITIFFIVWLSSGAQALPGAKSTPRQQRASVPQATRLRVGTPLVLYSRRRGHQTIEHLNVTVSNVGLAIATQVDVSAEFPDGIAYPLKGPRKIAPGQRCLYSLGGKKTVLRAQNPRIVTSCGSCVP